jgi:hypothetical protein
VTCAITPQLSTKRKAKPRWTGPYLTHSDVLDVVVLDARLFKLEPPIVAGQVPSGRNEHLDSGQGGIEE